MPNKISYYNELPYNDTKNNLQSQLTYYVLIYIIHYKIFFGHADHRHISLKTNTQN